MKIIPLLSAVLLASSCSGIKVLKEPPPQESSKQGITFGKGAVGRVEVQKVGFWCEAKHGLLTFGEFGPTEAEAKAKAQGKCRNMFKDGSCEISSCKPA